MLGGLACCLLLALSAAPANALIDLSGPAFQILAPGEEGGLVPGPNSGDQAVLYDKLTPLKSEAQSQEYLTKPAKRGE